MQGCRSGIAARADDLDWDGAARSCNHVPEPRPGERVSPSRAEKRPRLLACRLAPGHLFEALVGALDSQVFAHRKGGNGERVETLLRLFAGRSLLRVIDLPYQEWGAFSLLQEGRHLEKDRIAAREIRKAKGFRVSFPGAACREKTKNGRRGLGVPLTQPRKIVIVAKATRRVQKAFAAPLDQAPAVGYGDRSRQGAEKAMNAVVGLAFHRLEMKLSCCKEH